MSFGRKTYDGNFPGRHTGSAEWGNSVGGKSKAVKHAPPKRTIKDDELVDPESSPFTESGDKDRYLITYADLITLLLGLFIILYAISKIDSKKYEKVITAMSDVFGSKTKIGLVTNKAQIQPPKPVDSPLKAELAKLIQRSGYSKSIRLDENKRGITIHILDDILFSSGSADLTAGSLKVLNKIAAILRELPNDIRVEGHTDDVPISTKFFPSNWHLSVARALNTAYYLIHDEGLKPDKVSIVGYSKYKPIALNDSPEGRAENRRVDIVIIKNKAL